MIKYVIIIFFALSATANAKISIGSSILYSKQNHPTLKFTKYIDQFKPTSLTAGYMKKINKFAIGIYTNRLINIKLKREVTNGTNNFNYYSSTRYNLLQVGYIRKNIMPNIFVSDVILDQELYFNNVKIEHSKDRVYLFGLGANIFLDKQFNLNLNYIMPRESIGLEGGLSFGINYLF
jgi:hypothetical protein